MLTFPIVASQQMRQPNISPSSSVYRDELDVTTPFLGGSNPQNFGLADFFCFFTRASVSGANGAQAILDSNSGSTIGYIFSLETLFTEERDLSDPDSFLLSYIHTARMYALSVSRHKLGEFELFLPRNASVVVASKRILNETGLSTSDLFYSLMDHGLVGFQPSPHQGLPNQDIIANLYDLDIYNNEPHFIPSISGRIKVHSTSDDWLSAQEVNTLLSLVQQGDFEHSPLAQLLAYYQVLEILMEREFKYAFNEYIAENKLDRYSFNYYARENVGDLALLRRLFSKFDINGSSADEFNTMVYDNVSLSGATNSLYKNCYALRNSVVHNTQEYFNAQHTYISLIKSFRQIMLNIISPKYRS